MFDDLDNAANRDDDNGWQITNCLGVDPDLFFPERGASTQPSKCAAASCVPPGFALQNGEKFGIWGGLSERERRRIRRQRAQAAQRARRLKAHRRPARVAWPHDRIRHRWARGHHRLGDRPGVVRGLADSRWRATSVAPRRSSRTASTRVSVRRRASPTPPRPAPRIRSRTAPARRRADPRRWAA